MYWILVIVIFELKPNAPITEEAEEDSQPVHGGMFSTILFFI